MDGHNKSYHLELVPEKMWITHNPYLRFITTIFDMVATDACKALCNILINRKIRRYQV